jgi:hypothetical protein
MSAVPPPPSNLSYTGGCQCGTVRYRIQRETNDLGGDDGNSEAEASRGHEDHDGGNHDKSTQSGSGLLMSADFCHCRMCQKAFGNVGAALVRVRTSDFRWTRGIPATFRSSSAVTRGFCDRCGTPLYMAEDDDDCCDVAVGTLDDPGAVAYVLNQQVGIECKLPWFDSIGSLPVTSTDQDRASEGLAAKIVTFQHPDHDTATWPA